ncbi:hypothetical protein Leryth_016394 [Lithospermum erythrorhizon]|nr:hypothetical protein Leryth_016394 [Lithospermum erythrorhizon]
MQDIFGSVRRSLVFRSTMDDSGDGRIVEKINSCIRKSRVFTKPSPPPLMEPKPAIRWRKGELIGCGAFGQVYMGMNLDSGELLAVKQVLIPKNHASKEKAQMHIKEIEEEVKLLKNLSHPNIVRYLGTVREEETLNILLEFVPGGSISSLLGKFGSFPEAVIRMYTKQLLLGLDYLHTNGIMHRDIKGANILVDNKGCIKLADFGASKQVVELATVTGAKSMKGTPYWMAPEVILQTGHRFSADIWSVGCTVIEMATGRPPWSQQYQGQEVAALFYIGTTKAHPPIPDHISPEAKDFLLKCLQKEPESRPTASQLLQHPFVTGELLHSPPDPNISTEDPENLFLVHGEKLSNSGDSMDLCNLGTLNFSAVNPQTPENVNFWGATNLDDDEMCQIGDNDSLILEEDTNFKASLVQDKSFNQVNCHNDGNTELGQQNLHNHTAQEYERLGNSSSGNHINGFSFHSGLSEDDDEVTENKIRAFLDEKALELKKLQSPLYEEFYNSLNPSCSPSFADADDDNTKYLKLPPTNKSPTWAPPASDMVFHRSPGSGGRRISNASSSSNKDYQENISPQPNDMTAKPADIHPEPNSPRGNFIEIQRKWKEELDQELERKREMLRQTAAGGKTSSPNDRTVNRQRSRFASPSK